MATLLVQYGCYHCAECMQPISFEGELDRSNGTGIGACGNSWGKDKCDRAGLRMRVKLLTIEVEELHDA